MNSSSSIEIDIDQLAARLEELNRAYREGRPLVDDDTYDRLVEQLRALDPQHVFLQAVEGEQFTGRREIRHPVPMLSTEKAYTAEQLERFVQRVHKEARQIGIDTLEFKVTAKLDGLAGRDDGEVLVSRGNGLVGYDISNAFDRGVVPVGGRGQGLGEIVVVQSYFEAHLADKFEHPRNMVVGIVTADTLNEDAREAINQGMVRFVPYIHLPTWVGDGDRLFLDIEVISDLVMAEVDYPMDGAVVEVLDERVKGHMGATAHHFRWQIAVKRKGETAQTTVQGIQWQVGRTGNVTPVMEVEPVLLSGATIRRVTAHHAGMINKLGIGIGARIEIIRSGEVIPKLEQVITPAAAIEFPKGCPACEQELTWEGDFLKCLNPGCIAQTQRRITHWFHILGNADWFGFKTVEKLVDNGFDRLEKIYAMAEDDFVSLGFGPVQSRNLAQALSQSRTKPVEDWRFLAAMGLPHLGLGDSRKLLEQVDLDQVFDLKAEEIAAIKGFGEEKSRGIVKGIAALKSTIAHLRGLGFSLIPTVKAEQKTTADHPFFSKRIVFTGTMEAGSREEMQTQARQLGALVQTSVTGNTDYLVCGQRVGQSKLDKAGKAGVTVISEAEYYELLEKGRS